ncbi:MAG: flippase-like domain-containing protein [Pseudomonadota bacterium]|nr:flippase-like domain-containing protein [Pseudomonadota bacterium]
MLLNDLGLYVLASFLLLLAHVFRAARWALLFPAQKIHRRFDLLLGLAIAYALNAIIPWRLGELARIWFVAGRTSVRISSVAATVVAERLSDLVVVSLIAVYVIAGSENHDWRLPAGLMALAASFVLLSFLIQKSDGIRRLIWHAASVFNKEIRFGLIDFFWSFSEMIAKGAIVRPRFLMTTLMMWLIYILSYAAFSSAAQENLSDMIFAMLGSPFRPSIDQLRTGEGAATLMLPAFTTFPVLGVLLYGGLKQLPAVLRVLDARRRYGWYASRGSLSSLRHHYKGESEYEYFLVSLFSGANATATSFGLEAIDDGMVHKLFPGGSEAITAMVEVNQNLLIRKFAVGAAGEKLKLQRDWLGTYHSDSFPLASIVSEREKARCYYYDMPLVVPSNDFYDYIHTHPIEGSKRIISEVLECVSVFHEQHAGMVADEAVVRRYLLEKAVNNASLVLSFARNFLGSRYTINGNHFNFKQWECLLDLEWLSRQVSRRMTTVVHGDLTIENIIVAPQHEPGWYIIDPNPDNIFNTRLIDWAKLMQSVHLGYEGLNRNFNCTVAGDAVQLAFTKSLAYTELHAHLEKLARRQYGNDGLREVYFHELINYLRLTPYKIRHDPKKGMCFFGCTSILLNRYLEIAL